MLHRQTACASGYARGVAQFLEICRKTAFFRGRFWGPPGFIKCIGGTILASKIWTLFWPPWAAGGPLLGRLGIHFWGGFWCPYGLSEVDPRTPQKRTPGRPSGPKWRPHFGCENSSACEAYTHTHMWPSAAPPPRQQTPGLERSPVSPSTASSISATTADHAFSSRLACERLTSQMLQGNDAHRSDALLHILLFHPIAKTHF